MASEYCFPPPYCGKCPSCRAGIEKFNREERERKAMMTTTPDRKTVEQITDAAGNEAQKCLRCGQYAVDCCGYGKWEERPLDPEKVAEVLDGNHFIEHGPGYGEHLALTPEACRHFARALCEAHEKGELS